MSSLDLDPDKDLCLFPNPDLDLDLDLSLGPLPGCSLRIPGCDPDLDQTTKSSRFGSISAEAAEVKERVIPEGTGASFRDAGGGGDAGREDAGSGADAGVVVAARGALAPLKP